MSRTYQFCCALCGSAVKPPFEAQAAEAPADLDFRPGMPARGTLSQWLQTCRTCGATAPDLGALPLSAAEVVRSDNYKWLARHAPHVRPFLRWARLCPAELRGDVLLQAAWAEDDAGNDAAAAALRLRAIRAWGPPTDIAGTLRQIDVLRRAEAWERAEIYADWLAGEDIAAEDADILGTQRHRIAARDSSRVRTAGAAYAAPPPETGWISRFLRRSASA